MQLFGLALECKVEGFQCCIQLRFIHWASFVGLSQHASSKMASFSSRKTSVARQLASIQTFMPCSSMHQTSWPGLFCFILSIVSIIIHLRTVSSILSFYPFVTTVACHLMTPGVSHTQGGVPQAFHTGKTRFFTSLLRRHLVLCVLSSM